MSDAPSPSRRPDRRPAVCVYCGAKTGDRAAYLSAAAALGRGVAERGWRLVYGAGDLGLMGATARACLEAGGEAVGFIPRGLWEREIASRELPYVVITENLHQRKALMLQNADAVAVLPGGLGTLDELAECVTWAQLGLHRKRIVMVDVEGFWRPLRALFEHFAAEGFLHADLDETLDWAADPQAALARLDAVLGSAGGGAP